MVTYVKVQPDIIRDKLNKKNVINAGSILQ